MKDIRTILRLTHKQGLSVREVAERLKIGKASVSTICCGRGRRGCRAGHCRQTTTMLCWNGFTWF
ncbi:hypothetical protein SAMCFNEI73_pB0232 (plasmid) [Sinorhizobium americanum]|uniref:Uncharacterized protein n=1 Tax=Sinorhizobium americanum TaxID=194963 RepID=A0A1L3LTK9_9HYPH|nr:hypothetical protein SAMCFNEI73_pB0232 [Sinorhizobium americanum]